MTLSVFEWSLVATIFVWSGFVRSGLGFGGAALAMPLMLFIVDNPLLWLPMAATHLLVFSVITVYDRIGEVDWVYLKKSHGCDYYSKINWGFRIIKSTK